MTRRCPRQARRTHFSANHAARVYKRFAAVLVLGLASSAAAEPASDGSLAGNDLVVTNVSDSGEGSLRRAILDANARSGPDVISFDSDHGTFAVPRTIRLTGPLPVLTEDVTINGYIEDRLWQATGVTVSGGGAWRVFEVAEGVKATIESITVAEASAPHGGGVLNRGELVIKGMTFLNNAAEHEGGGLANRGGKLTVINSTFYGNRAGWFGGGLASAGGTARVTNSTFSDNTAPRGGGLYSNDALVLANTILVNSQDGVDCVATAGVDAASTNNLIETNEGCGHPVSTADPRLGRPEYYNGPTQTMPLGGGSPAINLGDNASAVDEAGRPLVWDQRGNGDPRFVGGITDLGAFERQAFPELVVDTYEDSELRACTRGGQADCSLRGAIALANAMDEPEVITFDPEIFSVPRTIVPEQPLPKITTELPVDARGGAEVTLAGEFAALRAAAEGALVLHHIKLESGN
jgi:predicted outer membrane repeat protein